MPATPETTDNSLHLVIRDFGPIADANIRLRPLTVFIGPSGSGKTFAAAALDSVARAGMTVFSGMREASLFAGYNERVKGVVDELATAYEHDWARLLARAETVEEGRAHLGRWMAKGKHMFGEHVAGVVWSNCMTMLRAKTEDVTPFGTARRPAFGLFPPGAQMTAQAGGAVVPDRLFVSQMELPLDMEWAYEWALERKFPVDEKPSAERMGQVLAVALFSRFARSCQEWFGPMPLYMPAGRTGLLEAAIPITSALMAAGGRIELAGPMLTFLPLLPQAMQAGDGELAGVIDDIEDLLQGGRIAPQPGPSPIPDLLLHRGGHAIPMVRASASVSELAAVTFILRRLGKKNALVVIEEPEAHLHPAKQVLLARALARLVRAGVRLVITTHSEFLVDTLGWLLRGSEVVQPTRPPIPEAERLHPDEVAVYRFHERTKGGGYTATEVPFDPDEGFDRAEFLDIAGDLFNRHANVSRKQRAQEKRG